jgi:hypothetical protein
MSMRTNFLTGVVAAAFMVFAASPAMAQDFLSAPLLMGVYECNDQALGRHKDLMFALLDDTTYNDYLGRRGTYAYDSSTGILEIGLQKGAPARYVRVYENAFRGIDETGAKLGFNCPLNTSLDPINPRW